MLGTSWVQTTDYTTYRSLALWLDELTEIVSVRSMKRVWGVPWAMLSDETTEIEPTQTREMQWVWLLRETTEGWSAELLVLGLDEASEIVLGGVVLSKPMVSEPEKLKASLLERTREVVLELLLEMTTECELEKLLVLVLDDPTRNVLELKMEQLTVVGLERPMEGPLGVLWGCLLESWLVVSLVLQGAMHELTAIGLKRPMELLLEGATGLLSADLSVLELDELTEIALALLMEVLWAWSLEKMTGCWLAELSVLGLDELMEVELGLLLAKSMERWSPEM